MKILVIIDFLNTLMRSLAVNQELEYGGVPTGGIYGFFNQLVKLIHIHQPTHYLICKDKKPYLREELFPNYKGDRKKKKRNDDFDFGNALTVNTDLTNTLLKELGLPTWAVQGLEADDLIAFAVDMHQDEFDKIIVLSNDTDLNQLLIYDNVRLYKKSKFSDSDGTYGIEGFNEEFGVPIETWTEYTALVGTHNGVPGFRGIGPKTAAKILLDTNKHEAFKDENKEELQKKVDLITLPFPFYERKVRMPKVVPMDANYRNVIYLLENLGITFTNKMREAIE